MDTVFIIVLLMLMGVMNLLAFLIGAKVSQKVQKGEDLKAPSIKQFIENYRVGVAQREDDNRNSIMLENINNYSGDGLGQKDIP